MSEEMEQIEESIRRMQNRADSLTLLKTKTILEIDSVIAEIIADIRALELQLETMRYTNSHRR